MKRVNPIYVLFVLTVLVHLGRAWLLPDSTTAEFGALLQRSLDQQGTLGYFGVVMAYSVCSFFFIPLLIPLNILCGALYGAYVGTAVSLLGITIGCLASTISVRHVFKGMRRAVDAQPRVGKILEQVSRHGAMVVIAVRLAFIVPYLLQNIVLAATSIGIYRLALLTLIGSLPGAAIYSFIGAGLMRAESANELALYLAVPLILLVIVTIVAKRINSHYQTE